MEKRGSTVVLSWNCRGLNHPIKRSKVFSHISKQKASIVYLQETHLIPKDLNKLKRGGFQNIFHSKFTGKSRGTAILIHRDVSSEESKVIADKQGRYVIAQGKLFNQQVLLVNIYAPNWDSVHFCTSSRSWQSPAYFRRWFKLYEYVEIQLQIIDRWEVCWFLIQSDT